MTWANGLAAKAGRLAQGLVQSSLWLRTKANIQGPWAWSRTGWAKAGFAVAALFGYYLIGGWIVEDIDTDPASLATPIVPHQSRAVSVAALLTHREVDRHAWVPADPIFLPGWSLTAMPKFQQGIIAVIGHFAETLYVADGSGDPDLGQAAGLYKYPGTVWRLASGISWLPTAPSDRQYRHAAQALEAYNDRLAQGAPPSLRQAAVLSAIVTAVHQDMQGMADQLEHHLEGRPFALWDHRGTVLFHTTRGRLYAWALILRELGQDDADLIADKGLTGTWRRMVDGLFTAASMSPPMILSGSWDGSLLPNHLAEQGYLMLRVNAPLDDITAALKG